MKKFLLFLLLVALPVVLGVTVACTGDPSTTTDTTRADTRPAETDPSADTLAPESLPPAPAETQPAETAEETQSLLTGAYAASIERAEHLSGEVNAAYNSDRSTVTLSNRMATLHYPLTGHREGSALTTPGGHPYLTALPEVYVKNTDGDTYRLTDTGNWERMNIYRLGSYYYEIHMLDGRVGFEIEQAEALSLRKFRTGNGIRNIQASTDGVSYTVSDPVDPYLNSGFIGVDTGVFNALEITVSTTAATEGQIHIAAGPYPNISGKQYTTFHTQPDGKPHTYVIPLDHIDDYYGTLSYLRVDLGAREGEEIRIDSMRMVRLRTDGPAIKLDRTFHLYADKLNDIVRVVAEEDVPDLAALGTVTRIPTDSVEALIVRDQNGTHTDLDGVQLVGIEYVGFAIRDAGVFGMILLPDESSGTLTVTEADGYYVITREYVRTGSTTLAAGESLRSGVRLYTDLNRTFDAFLAAAACERNPLTEISVTSAADGARYVGYDVFRGAYRFEVDGINFVNAFKNPDRRFRIEATFEGASTDYPIYVYSSTVQGNLECGVILSDKGELLPIATEVCKNFHGENEEPFYDRGDTPYGEVIFPMVIGAEDTTAFTIVNLYQNWGRFPLKQLSSIQFIAPYYHLSTGSTETNCIAPYYVFGKDLWTLPDFRAMSAPLWTDQPQHASIGRLYFLRYTDADGGSFGSESVSNRINAYGPTYADIDMQYISDDGRITADYRHLEYPQWDENRTYYTIELTVNDTVSFKNFKEDFTFFSFDSRDRLFKRLGYLDKDGVCTVTDAATTDNQRLLTLGADAPYVSLFDGDETSDLTAYVNFGVIVKEASITIGGERLTPRIVLREHKQGGINRLALSLELGEVTLQKGDRLVIDLILLPWGDPSSDSDENVRRVREDACLDPYRVTATTGTVLEDTYLPRVIAANGIAEFTLSGGAEASAVRVYGFPDYAGIKVEELVEGTWVEYRLSSDGCDYDGYTVIYDGDGTFSYAFLVNMDEGSRTLRVTGK